ncbi:MAG TPA: lipoyl(octanoyl) transferase LipB [Pseudomonadales bacterium]|nr:lipoyl(octanoyl) transferase LipB [Pseudomonadales bacterium]
MQRYTATRDASGVDELWLLEHPPVFTQGQAGKPEHLLFTGDIPVVQSDRGGQVTYHGPGQVVGYVLFDIKRADYGVRDLVSAIENAIIDVLARYGIVARARADAPGVYVGEAKIAQLGLRIKRGCSYHGLSLNVDMDMEPFLRINPCGYQGMPVICMRDLLAAKTPAIEEVQAILATAIAKQLNTNISDSVPIASALPY